MTTTTSSITEQRHDASASWELAGWDPWAAVGQNANVSVHVDKIAWLAGGAAVMNMAGQFFIVLAPGLDPWSEAHALTHELIHVERGLGFEEAERKDEEATVRRLTRCRMAFYDGRVHESVPAVGR